MILLYIMIMITLASLKKMFLREVQRQLARDFESKYKRRRTMMIKISVAVVKCAMRNEASHAMTHIGGPAPGPLEGLSSFVGRFSSSEVLANMSMI